MAGKSVMLIAAVVAVVAVAAGAVVFSGVMDNDDDGTVTLKYRDPVVGDTVTGTIIGKGTDSDGTTYAKTVSQSTIKSIEDGKYVIVKEDTISTSTDGKNYVISDTYTDENSEDALCCISGTEMNDVIADYIDWAYNGMGYYFYREDGTQISSEGTVSYFGATLEKESVFSRTDSDGDGTMTSVVKMSTESSNISTSWGEVATKVLNVDITMSHSVYNVTDHCVLKMFCYDFDGEAFLMKFTRDIEDSWSSSSVVITMDTCSFLSKA